MMYEDELKYWVDYRGIQTHEMYLPDFSLGDTERTEQYCNALDMHFSIQRLKEKIEAVFGFFFEPHYLNEHGEEFMVCLRNRVEKPFIQELLPILDEYSKLWIYAYSSEIAGEVDEVSTAFNKLAEIEKQITSSRLYNNQFFNEKTGYILRSKESFEE